MTNLMAGYEEVRLTQTRYRWDECLVRGCDEDEPILIGGGCFDDRYGIGSTNMVDLLDTARYAIRNPDKTDIVMDAERRSYDLRYRGHDLSIATNIRLAGDDLIMFVHGFGCCKETFDPAFEISELKAFSLCSFDFPSHGESSALPPEATSLQSYADIANRILAQVPHQRIFLVCHSMGAAVGLLAVQDLTEVICFVSVEGNLVSEDCGIVSRSTASQPRADFVHGGFGSFLRDLRASPQSDLQMWAGWYARCDPSALHEISRSLVEWSDSGKLLQYFLGIRNAHYVFGRDSDLNYLLPQLKQVPTHQVDNAGHFAMLDNASQFYDIISEIVRTVSSRNQSVSLASH